MPRSPEDVQWLHTGGNVEVEGHCVQVRTALKHNSCSHYSNYSHYCTLHVINL